MNSTMVTVDVREDLKAGRQPCGRIMDAVAALGPGQSLRLLVPFEPVPLYSVLAARGFQHSTRQLPEGDFEVVFVPTEQGGIGEASADLPEEATGAAGCGCGCGGAREAEPTGEVELDLRGLAPPEPMTRVLETLVHLSAGTTLVVRTDRQPLHLYPLLARRGFQARTEALPDGSFMTRIDPA
jgi:uncharacterized protein (DUF2249 family)